MYAHIRYLCWKQHIVIFCAAETHSAALFVILREIKCAGDQAMSEKGPFVLFQ
jgi:hypothetical protein